MRIPRWDYMPVKGSPNKYHKPLFHYRYISLAAFLLLFIAFIIFFLVTLSVPIIKTIFLLELKAAQNPKQPPTSIANTITLGVWGLCTERYVGSVQYRVCDFNLSSLLVPSTHPATLDTALDHNWDSTYPKTPYNKPL